MNAKRRFESFLIDVKKLGYSYIVTSYIRSYNEQARQKEKDSRNAAAGSSDHEFGNAIDINLKTKSGKLITKSSSRSEWLATGVPELAKKHGLNWGGNFKKYFDPVHYYIA